MRVTKRAYLKPDMARWLEEEAERLGVSESSVVALALNQYKSKVVSEENGAKNV